MAFTCYCGKGGADVIGGAAAAADDDDGPIEAPGRGCICADEKIQDIYRQIHELNLLEDLVDEDEGAAATRDSDAGGGRGEEDEDEDEDEGEVEEEDHTVILDADHPLMISFQSRLKMFLHHLDEDLTIQLREAKKNLEEVVREEKEIGQRANETEQELRRRHADFAEAQAELETCEADRKEKEEAIQELRIDNERAMKEESSIRREAEQKQKEVEKSNLDLYLARTHQEGAKSLIDVNRRAAMKAKQEVDKLEPKKEQQDILVERWLRDSVKLQEEVAMFENLTKAQKEETKAAREAINEAKTELGAIDMEKKEIMQQWSDSLLLTKKRDEAKESLQMAIDGENREGRRIRSEVEGFKRSIVGQHRRNEHLAQQVNRAETELATFTNLLEKNEEEFEQLKQVYSLQHKLLQQAELNASRARIEAGQLSRTSRELHGEIDAIVASRHDKEEAIDRQIKQMHIHDNQSESLRKKTAVMRETTRRLEKDTSALASEIVSKKLEVTDLEVSIQMIEEKLSSNSVTLKEKDVLLDEIEAERNRRNNLIERKQVNITQLMHKVATNMEATGGEELGPLEVYIKQVTRSIDELSGKTVKTQERWLRLQNQLVAWQRKYAEIDSEANYLGKTIIVWEKKKAKTEKLIEGVERDILEMEHNCDMMRKDTQKLNLLLFRTTNDEDVVSRTAALSEEFAYRELEETELRMVKAMEKLKELQDDKLGLLEQVEDANTQIALWERKIEITKEMKSSVDKMWGQGELGMMKTEVQKMQHRMRQLKHQQDLLVQDMERAVARRESIHARGNKPFKPWEGKSTVKSSFMRENEALAEKIKKYSSEVQKADGELNELQKKRDGLADDIYSEKVKNFDLHKERVAEERLNSTLSDKKMFNLQKLVADQQKNKWYDQVRQKKYVAAFKTKEATNKEIQKQQDRLQHLNNIVEKVRKEHPEAHNALKQNCTLLEERTIRMNNPNPKKSPNPNNPTAKTGCHCGAEISAECTCWS